MKGFSRKCLDFSLCGLNCGLCTMKLGGYCPGCGGGEGNQSCGIARCSVEHGGIQFCSDCAEYPCRRYEGFDDYDSFIPHSRRPDDLKMAGELGLDSYLSELAERKRLLEELLHCYNDGRRKTLFATAAYLLPVDELRRAVFELRPSSEQPLKERARLASSLLNSAAERLGLSLKLRKHSSV